MADHSPILLIIDPQTTRFSSLNEHLLPVLNYVQTRYSVVLLARRQGHGALSFPAVRYAKSFTRSVFSASSALRGIDCTGRAVHVSMPDVDYALVSTVFDLVEKGVHLSVLSELCGSASKGRQSRGWLNFLKMALGDERVVRACEYVPADRFGAERMAEPFLTADVRQNRVSQLLGAVGTFEVLNRLSEMLMLDDGPVDRVPGSVRVLQRPSGDVTVACASSVRYVGHPVPIDDLTSAALYRVASEPARNGLIGWSADMLAREMNLRGMACSLGADRICQHFEDNERDIGLPSPLGTVKKQASLDLSGVILDPQSDGADSGVLEVNGSEDAVCVFGVSAEPVVLGDFWVVLSNFRVGERPDLIELPDGTVRKIGFWCDILYAVVDWLFQEGLVGVLDCPVRLGRSQVPIIDDYPRVLEAGQKKGGYRVLTDGMYLRTKSNRHDTIENSKALLGLFGVDPSSFRLCCSGVAAT